MEEPELLPCPFCGNRPHWIEWNGEDGVEYGVLCGTCDKEYGRTVRVPAIYTKEEAADVWNDRRRN